MYTVVLLAALTSAEGSAGMGFGHKGYPYQGPPCPGCNHNHGGWGLPYGGYNWPGYAGWGGCGGYASAAYGVPMTPLVSPAPPMDYDDPDEEKDGKNGKKNGKKNGVDDDAPPTKKGKSKMSEEDDDVPPLKKGKPKKGKEEDDTAAQAQIVLRVPAGARVQVDGKPVSVTGSKALTTPALEKGYTYYYEVRVEVVREGKPVVETRNVTVRAGAEVSADFRNLGRADVAAK